MLLRGLDQDTSQLLVRVQCEVILKLMGRGQCHGSPQLLVRGKDQGHGSPQLLVRGKDQGTI